MICGKEHLEGIYASGKKMLVAFRFRSLIYADALIVVKNKEEKSIYLFLKS